MPRRRWKPGAVKPDSNHGYRSKATGFLLACLLAATASAQPSLDALIDGEIGSLVATYKRLHAAPELSHYEEKTAAFFAGQLRALGYTVTEHVGKFDRPEWVGYGVVAVMRNRDGPTVLARTDLDALPIEEKTGLAYASTVKTRNDAGQEVGVMHACGHDIHITTMLGVARMMARLKDRWQGTLVLIGQPAEETIDGARAMLKDGLYERFPRPAYALALHDNPEVRRGTGGLRGGLCAGQREQCGHNDSWCRRARFEAGGGQRPRGVGGGGSDGAADHC